MLHCRPLPTLPTYLKSLHALQSFIKSTYISAYLRFPSKPPASLSHAASLGLLKTSGLSCPPSHLRPPSPSLPPPSVPRPPFKPLAHNGPPQTTLNLTHIFPLSKAPSIILLKQYFILNAYSGPLSKAPTVYLNQ